MEEENTPERIKIIQMKKFNYPENFEKFKSKLKERFYLEKYDDKQVEIAYFDSDNNLNIIVKNKEYDSFLKEGNGDLPICINFYCSKEEMETFGKKTEDISFNESEKSFKNFDFKTYLENSKQFINSINNILGELSSNLQKYYDFDELVLLSPTPQGNIESFDEIKESFNSFTKNFSNIKEKILKQLSMKCGKEVKAKICESSKKENNFDWKFLGGYKEINISKEDKEKFTIPIDLQKEGNISSSNDCYIELNYYNNNQMEMVTKEIDVDLSGVSFGQKVKIICILNSKELLHDGENNIDISLKNKDSRMSICNNSYHMRVIVNNENILCQTQVQISYSSNSPAQIGGSGLDSYKEN